VLWVANVLLLGVFGPTRKDLGCKAQSGAPLLQGAPAGGMQQVLRTKLEQIIAANQLQQFYPPQALQAVLMRLNNVDFRRAPFTATPSSRLTILLQSTT